MTPPLILMAHGGGNHKKHPVMAGRAHFLVTGCGFHVAVIDAPGHGDRPRPAHDERDIAELLRCRATEPWWRSRRRQENGVLHGDKVGLRARHETDIPILQAELYDDVVTRSRADSRPWRPIPPGSAASPYAVADPTDAAACFSVVELPGNELAGEALLWGIDLHNRTAHLGISLLPACRGRGLGADVIRVLCHYGFAVRGLHRLQIETISDNAAMIRVAAKTGFTQEGILRNSAWVGGDFADEVILGQLASEWHQT